MRDGQSILAMLPNVGLAIAADLAIFALWDADKVVSDYADELDSPLDPVVTDIIDNPHYQEIMK